MQKKVPAATLDLLRDLLAGNEYELLPDGDPTPPSVVDVVLDELVWPNAIEDLIPVVESQAPEAVGPLERIGAWRIPFRVRKATVAAGDSITVGAYDGPGATVQPFEPGRPGNLWVAVVTETMPSAAPHTVVDLSSGPAEIYPGIARWVLTEETGGGPSDLRDELEAADDPVAILDLLPVPTGDFVLGPFSEGATVYVGFPREGILDYPDWFLDDFSEAGEQIVVDRALKIGGGAGGTSAEMESGGAQSHVDLPEFAGPFLGDTRIRFDVPSVIESFLGVEMIANIRSVEWAPGSGDGSLQLDFVEEGGKPALALILEVGTDADDEIHVIDGPDLDIEDLKVTLFFVLDVREGRLYWVPKAKAEVSLESGLVPDGELQDIENSVAGQIEATVTDELPPHLMNLVGSWLGALPVVRHDQTFTPSLAGEPALQLALKLLEPVDLAGTTPVHEPEYPTSLLPSSLRQAVLSDPQRILDRFVRYQGVSVEPDPDAAGRNRLVVDYEYFPQHASRTEDQGYTHEAIPRETFSLKPLALRPGLRDKWAVAWSAYTGRALLELMELVREGGPYWWAERYMPKLVLEYEVRVEHEALPDSSRVWHEKKSYLLAELPFTGPPRYYFSGTELTPAGFTGHLHHLEMPSLLNEAAGDVIHGATVTIQGEATLEYWQESDPPRGCGAVLLDILRRRGVRDEVEEAEAEAQSGGLFEEPTEPAVLEADVRDRYEKVVEPLGPFSGPGAAGLAMDDNSGLAPSTGAGNKVTVGGLFGEVVFLLERHSVDPDAYDWIQAAFRSFSLQIDEKGDLEESTAPIDVLRDGRPFDVVARLQGDEVATARYRLERGSNAPGTILEVGRHNVLDGEQWKRELYFPTDATDFFVTASLEIRRHGQLLAEVGTSWPRTADGADWSDREEWGIPSGHPSVTRTLVSDDQRLKVNLELRNRLHDPTEVPLEHRPKELAFSFDEVKVLDDKDPFAAGELEYWVDVERRKPGEEGFVQVGDRRRSRVMELSTGDTTDPDLADVEERFKPDDELRVVARGREIDNPRWFDPHDYLDRARESRMVTFSDQQDGPMQLDSPDFLMDVEIRTVSKPGAPRLHVWTGTDWRSSWQTDSTGNPTVVFRVYGSWTDSLELRGYEGSGSDRKERPESSLALPGPLPVGEYGSSLPPEVSLTPPDDPNAAPEDFVYYVTLSPAMTSGESRSYQLVATNVAGYRVSDGYVRVSVV